MEAKECRSWPPSACCQPALPGTEQLPQSHYGGTLAGALLQEDAQAPTSDVGSSMGSAHRQTAQKKLKHWETLGGTKSKETPRRAKLETGRWGGRWSLSLPAETWLGLRHGLNRFGHGDIPLLSGIVSSGVAVAVGAAMGDRTVPCPTGLPWWSVPIQSFSLFQNSTKSSLFFWWVWLASYAIL